MVTWLHCSMITGVFQRHRGRYRMSKPTQLVSISPKLKAVLTFLSIEWIFVHLPSIHMSAVTKRIKTLTTPKAVMWIDFFAITAGQQSRHELIHRWNTMACRTTSELEAIACGKSLVKLHHRTELASGRYPLLNGHRNSHFLQSLFRICNSICSSLLPFWR